MKNEVQEIARRFWEFQALFTILTGVVLSVIMMWQLIGWPARFGSITVVIAQVVNIGYAKISTRVRRVKSSRLTILTTLRH